MSLMMTMTNPITPPPELVEKWVAEIWHEGTPVQVSASDIHIATQAAQWGANQELEACITWMDEMGLAGSGDIEVLRAARRPEPPRRKEQALEAISRLCASVIHDDLKNDAAIVRRALEALDD
jgi:hypothetical protein